MYANVSDTAAPASGIGSVAAKSAPSPLAATAAALTAGTYSAGGTAYTYRSAALTAAATLSSGSDNYTITATDKAGNAGTQSFTTAVDNTAPTAVDVQSTNVSGGTAGHLDQGNTLTLTYSEAMDPHSILPGWTGASTNVQVSLVGGGNAGDYVAIFNIAATPAQIPLGTISLGNHDYLKTGTGTSVIYGTTGAATPSTMTRSAATITITLGTASGGSSTSTTAGAMVWTPSTSATDIAGNPGAATTATQSEPFTVISNEQIRCSGSEWLHEGSS